MRTRRSLSLLLLLLVAGSGCTSDGDPDRVQQQLEAQERMQTALRDRIEELEGQVQALLVGASEPEEDPLADLDERLAAVEDTLEGLSTRIDQEVAGRNELAAQLDEVQSTITGMQSALGGLRDEVQELRENLESLDRRFRDHTDGHG